MAGLGEGGGGGADAQYFSYMSYKLPRMQWESSGMKNAALETQWVNAADNYVKKFPHGEHSDECRFRLGERLQRQKQYLEAAKIYDQVTGSNEYSFTAKFNAATSNYLALAAAESAKGKNAGNVNPEDLKKAGLLSIPVTLIILVVVFGSLVAAGIPLLLALTAIVAAAAPAWRASRINPVEAFRHQG